MPKKSASPAEQVTDKQVLAAAAKADREQVLAALQRWRETDTAKPCGALIDAYETSDAGYPFHTESEKFVGKAVSATPLADNDLEIHRISLRSMFRWNRAARLAAESRLMDEDDLSALLGDPLAAS